MDRKNIPECLLDAANVVHVPVLFGDVLLANGNTSPGHPHLGNSIDIVLVEVDLQRTEVTLRPLGQAPLLDDLLRLIELGEFAGHIAIEDGELASDLGALELARRGASESGNPLGISEGVVQFLSGRAELIGGGNSGGVDRYLAARRRRGGLGSSRLFLGLRMVGGSREPARRVDTRGMLEVFAVFRNQSGTKLRQLLSQLGHEFRPNQVLHGLLRSGIGVVFNLKLRARCR